MARTKRCQRVSKAPRKQLATKAAGSSSSLSSNRSSGNGDSKEEQPIGLMPMESERETTKEVVTTSILCLLGVIIGGVAKPIGSSKKKGTAAAVRVYRPSTCVLIVSEIVSKKCSKTWLKNGCSWRFSPSIIDLVQQRWRTWKTWDGQSLVALRGELSDKPEEWRSFGIRIASVDEFNDPQLYASACDSFVNEGPYRIGVSCSFCHPGTTAIVCANDTCHRSCCPICYTTIIWCCYYYSSTSGW
jgi:hypothetical protein